MNKSLNTLFSTVVFLLALIGPCEKSKNTSLFQILAPEAFVSKAEPERVHGIEIYNTCVFYRELSNQFNYKLVMNESGSGIDCYECNITLQIFSKRDSLIQTIKTKAESCAYPITAAENSHVRSFETLYNEKRKLKNAYYHGELVIGDFNFDSLVDIAIVRIYPMSGTPTYDYYFQDENSKFVRNAFYSDSIQHLPQNINSEKKTFRSYNYTGCCWRTVRHFKYDGSGECKLVRTKEYGPKE